MKTVTRVTFTKTKFVRILLYLVMDVCMALKIMEPRGQHSPGSSFIESVEKRAWYDGEEIWKMINEIMCSGKIRRYNYTSV